MKHLYIVHIDKCTENIWTYINVFYFTHVDVKFDGVNKDFPILLYCM